jgi:hypothetical protein
MRKVELVQTAIAALVIGACGAGPVAEHGPARNTSGQGASNARAAAQASATLSRLQAARAALASYDLEGTLTTDAVASMSAWLGEGLEPRRDHEVRFLRAVATSDLLILTARSDAHGVRARLARAWGVGEDALLGDLRRELEGLRMGAYRETADDALGALDALERDPAQGALELPPAGPAHLRRQIAFVSRAALALGSSDDLLALVTPLAEDPCAAGASCEAPYDQFGPAGRRAIAGMARIFGVLTALEQVAQMGDPLSAAFLRAGATLPELSLQPRDWAASVRATSASEGRELDADAIVVVGATRIRAGWAPAVRWGSDHRATVAAQGSAALGADSEVRVPVSADLLATSRIDALASAVETRLRGARRLAVVVEPETEARVLSAVLRTLSSSGVQPSSLGIATPEGLLRGAPVARVSTPDEADEALGLFVRMGGFTLRHGANESTLPRLRVDDRWEFDMAALAQDAARGNAARLTLRYMPLTDAAVVVRAAMIAAGTNRSLVVVP